MYLSILQFTSKQLCYRFFTIETRYKLSISAKLGNFRVYTNRKKFLKYF